MSAKDNQKEVKKSAPAAPAVPSPQAPVSQDRKPKLPTSVTPKSVSPTRKMMGQIKKRTSRMHAEVQEASVNEDEDISLMTSVKSSTQLASPPVPDNVIPPPFHYQVVTVKATSNMFGFQGARQLVLFSSNMIIGTLNFELMDTFISGDQIASVNGTPCWHDVHLLRILQKRWKELRLTPEVAKPFDVTVIRPYNIEPPSKTLLDSVLLDERFMYFVVTMGMKNLQGFATRFDKRRLIVSKIKANTAPSYALLIGDQLLAINDFVIPTKGSRKACLASVKTMWTAIKNNATVKIFASRPISARSSPCPSIDAELVEKFPESIKGMDKRGEKPDELNVPLEGDALEIAFRELVGLQQCIKPDAPLPYTCRGHNIIRRNKKKVHPFVAFALAKAQAKAQASASSTNLAEASASASNTNLATASASGTNVSAASQDRSMYMPLNSSAAASIPQYGMTAMGTPTKKKVYLPRKTWMPPVTFSEPAETTKITSDVAEEAELKKCDPRSGIVAYIKNAFNN